MKEVKEYNEHKAKVRVSELQREAKTLGEVIKLLREVTGDKEVKTIGAFNDWLCKEAGFKSASFSAESMDLGDAYRQVRYLTDLVTTVTVDDLTPMYTLKPKTVNKIKEGFTTYYTDEELANVKIFREAQDKFNSLPVDFRRTTGINRNGKLFSNYSNINSKNFSHI